MDNWNDISYSVARISGKMSLLWSLSKRLVVQGKF